MLRHPLYKELEAIGRVDKSLNPSALGRRKHVLESPEVQRRAAANPNTPLPVIAERALRDAIKTLPKGTRRTVGEAVLCARPTYKHLIVKQRRKLLEESSDKISYEQWRYHRKLVLEAVFDYLRESAVRPTSSKRTNAVPVQRQDDASIAEAERAILFIPFMERAIDLHYAGLAQLFTQDALSWLVGKSGLRFGVIFPTKTAANYLAHYLFDSFTELIGASWLGHGLEDILTPVLSSSANTVEDIFRTISDAAPTGLRAWSDDEALKPAATPEEKYAQYKAFTDRAYVSHWTPWYQEHYSLLSEPSRHSALSSIVALSGAIEPILLDSQLEPYVKIKCDPAHKQARLGAHKALSTYYGAIDDSTPLAGELSLRQHADAYFDMQGSLLTDRGRKLYSKEIETM